MRARDTDEPHRASTPLELLFDLVFVVAISQAVSQVAHALAVGHVRSGLVTFTMVFFAIWWAWMNFTWFASAYDVDDGPYRLFVMLQMVGVLVLAAGVSAAEGDSDLTAITLGYVVMRLAMVAQWLRAGRSDPVRRVTTHRFAVGISVVQVGLLLRLALPPSWAGASFVVMVAAEIAVPWWAERAAPTSWHPHHIAERYGLFTIILLGESVLASVTAVKVSIDEGGVTPSLVVIALSALVLLFALWWVYFLDPMGHVLQRRRGRAFAWGYGHFLVFASLALVGAGLELVTAEATHHASIGAVAVGYVVAGPVALYLACVWALTGAVRRRRIDGVLPMTLACIAILASPWLAEAGAPVEVVCAATAALTVIYVAVLINAKS